MRLPTLRVPEHRVTTRHSPSAYPFQCQPGLPQAGPLVGHDLLSGGAMFCYDPWYLYQRGIIQSPNAIVLGKIGKGKSSLVKTYLLRQFVFGRGIYVMDPKGEYEPLARELGIPFVRLEPGGTVRVNPLDPGQLTDPGAIARQRGELTIGLCESALRRPLSPAEASTLDAALAELRREATLADLLECFEHPTVEMARAVNTTVGDLAGIAVELAHVVRRMLTGALAGMFDGPTNIDLSGTDRGLVVDISALQDKDAFELVMVCASSWLTSVTAIRDARRRILCLDELWRTLNAGVAITRWLQSVAKLARSLGVSLVLVTHNLSDMVAQASDGAEAMKQALGLLASCETVIAYNQDSKEAGNLQDLLGLSEREALEITELDAYHGFWRVGSHVAIVRHFLDASERELVDTNMAMVA
ncbi:MAG: hypothetical protein M0014_13470 [Actinomycetota bacterium]|nr:hypothetical protein [Actinomycetota bacterium]